MLLRHLMTEGNKEKRYIGRTEEGVCKEGYLAVKDFSFPEVSVLISSPMLRCKETAAYLYPTQKPIFCEDLRECNFGDFENKNYKELTGNKAYQAWIDSNGTMPFPNGESIEQFKYRSKRGFLEVMNQLEQAKTPSVGFVTHGGNIMAILEAFADVKKDYYSWSVENGNGYLGIWKEGRLINICNIHS